MWGNDVSSHETMESLVLLSKNEIVEDELDHEMSTSRNQKVNKRDNNQHQLFLPNLPITIE